MTKTKFTPGEWKLANRTGSFVVRMGDKENSHGAVPYAAIGGLNLEGGGYAELRANTYLIAAAPDLYAMLVKIDQELYTGSLTLEIDAVLAKARGES